MIYCCQNKGCHYLFYGSAAHTRCPDCGKPHIRPATQEERTAYLRRRAQCPPPVRRTG